MKIKGLIHGLNALLLNEAGEGGGDGGSGADSGGSEGSGGQGSEGSGSAPTSGAGNPSTVFGKSDPQGGGVDDATNLDTVPEWASGFQDNELKSWIAKKAERWGEGGVESALKSHFELEKLKGAEASQLIKLEPIDNREAWHGPGGVFERLGRPQTADGYEMPDIPEERLGEGSIDLRPVFKESAFKVGLTGAQAKEMSADLNKALMEFEILEETKFVTSQNKDMDVVKGEWGDEFEKNMEVARRGAVALGFDVTTEDGQGVLRALEKTMGTRAAVMKMHEIGARMSEHGSGFHGGDGAPTSFMNEAQAQAEIERRIADPELQAKFLDGDRDELKKREQLYGFAYPQKH